MMTFVFSPSVKAYNFSAVAPSGQTLYYNIINGNVQVTHPNSTPGYPYNGYNQPSGNLTIPQSVNIGGTTYSVVSIDDDAFNSCNGLTSIIIPNTVTAIGDWAFADCSNITSISIGTAVTTIGDYCFRNCNSLTSINLPNQLSNIGDAAFLGCTNLVSLSIPNSVCAIGSWAFYNCSSLNSINIPSSISIINNYTFYNCNSLTSLSIGNLVSTIGDHAFDGCGNLSTISIGNHVISIGNYAFYGCGSLSSISIPNSVVSIGDYAFSGCYNSTNVTIGESVSTIGESAFLGCTGLSRTNYNGSIAQWCNISFGGSYNINYYSNNYSNPLIYSHQLYINDTLISYLFIPDSVTTIKPYAFLGCNSITYVSINNTVTTIKSRAFAYCNGLTTVSIGDSVTIIEDRAFMGCSNLHTVNFHPPIAPTIGELAFHENASDRVFNIPCGSYNSYCSSLSNFHSSLHEPLVEILFNVEAEDTTKGTTSIVHQHGRVVACDSSVIIRADSNYGYHFDHWSNGRTINPDTLFLSGDSSVTAFFSPNQYTLTLLSNDESLGSVSEGGTFNYLDTVLIEAIVTADHYHFVRWSDNNTDNPRQYVITGNDTLWAYFSIDKFTVTAVPNNSERGSVNGGREYSYGTVCTLTAGAFTGYQFAKWSDGTTSNPYIFAVSEDVDLRALFVTEGEQIFSINASSANPTMGKVYGSGYAVNGDEVNLRAVSYPSYHFSHWSDNDTNSTRTIEVHGNMTLTAYFAPNVGIADIIKNKVRIFSRDRQIIVEGSEGMRIWVFDMMGRIIYNGKTPVIHVQQTGVYIVKVGNYPARKVVVIR